MAFVPHGFVLIQVQVQVYGRKWLSMHAQKSERCGPLDGHAFGFRRLVSEEAAFFVWCSSAGGCMQNTADF
jgi:hypothetical protein